MFGSLRLARLCTPAALLACFAACAGSKPIQEEPNSPTGASPTIPGPQSGSEPASPSSRPLEPPTDNAGSAPPADGPPTGASPSGGPQ